MSFNPYDLLNNQHIGLVYPLDISGCKNVLLIDNEVKDAQLFYSSVNADTFPVIYSVASTKTELLELLQTTFPNRVIERIERIGLVFTSNGGAVKPFLDSKPFFTNDEELSVSPYSENVDFIVSVIKEFNVKNIDYLACDTLNYPTWNNYYTILTNETGVIVGASNDKTGNIKYGGDWVMESTSQNIELIYFTKSIEYYSYLLDPASSHNVAYRWTGTIWGTGYNSSGQLGISSGNTSNVNVLTKMNTTNNDASGKMPKYISCGAGHTIVLMTDGTIYGTGDNQYGQLGFTTNSPHTVTSLTPMPIPLGKIPKYISCGYVETIVLMTDGTIYGTGYNLYGQLGTGNINSVQLLTKMDPSETVIGTNKKTPKYISCGGDHYTIVLMTDGTIWGTGRNYNGQLGTGNNNSVKLLTRMDPSGTVISATNKIPKYISSGGNHTIVLMTDNTIWGTGSNGDGQLGTGNNNSVNLLTRMDPTGIVISDTNKIPKYISTGGCTIVLMTDGTIWGTGYNYYGQLGTGTYNNVNLLTRMDPTGIVISATNKIPKHISSGGNYTTVLMTDGTIWGTGINSAGLLGTGNNTSKVNVLIKMVGDNNQHFTYISNAITYDDIISDICFPAGTPIQTDQGIIEIDKINPYIHTINNKSIVEVTKTVTADKYLVEFKKNALALNYPTENTSMSQKHNVVYNGKMREAQTFLDEFENVVKVNYNGETLYNILMEDHSQMSINNLICDTLNPDSLFAKFYTKKCKYTDDVRDKIVALLMDSFNNKDYTNYNKLLQTY